ncbi:MAG: hypothetical protein ABSE51_14905 [Terracidiphilus sp.]|jgi:hypothetical protein
MYSQYPGQVTKPTKDSPELRSIAVLEWTGEPGHPKASRLVPVAVLDQRQLEGGPLQDGGIYMARPQPLALAGEVEYELQQDGKPMGLFDIENAGQEQGSWVGYGAWKPLAVPKPRPSMSEVARSMNPDDEDSDRPVLHRKHHAGDAPSASTAGSGDDSGSSSGTNAPAADPDRPTLHKKPSSGDTGDSGSSTSSGTPSTTTGSSTSTAPSTTSDPNQPTLHRHDTSDNDTASAPANDPDRPVLKKPKKKQPDDIGHVDSISDFTDPDRPRLKRGKSSGNGLDVVPTLMGLPPDMQQAVAVSDAKSRPEHPWAFVWANPDDEAKMKSALEDIARNALGLKPPAPAPTAKKTATHKSVKPAPAPPPAPLVDERFRVFELAYGSGATLVLTAHTGGPLAQQKFVTLIAQPDFYGNIQVLLKYVADGDRLDETPRMRLVDAVDAMADNRGELLFELRGQTQRQFALYRVLRGQAEKLFVTGSGEFGTESRE